MFSKFTQSPLTMLSIALILIIATATFLVRRYVIPPKLTSMDGLTAFGFICFLGGAAILGWCLLDIVRTALNGTRDWVWLEKLARVTCSIGLPYLAIRGMVAWVPIALLAGIISLMTWIGGQLLGY